jgi:hypothetical protein
MSTPDDQPTQGRAAALDPAIARLVAAGRWHDAIEAIERLAERTEDPALKAELLLELGDM